MTDATPSRSWGYAWIGLALALGLHVADEALTGFLPLWNETVGSVREIVPWLPLPTFPFGLWLGGLIAGVVVLFALSPYAFQGKSWLRPMAYFLGVIMTLNAIGHAAASIVRATWAPGVFSSPVLLAAAIWLLVETRKAP